MINTHVFKHVAVHNYNPASPESNSPYSIVPHLDEDGTQTHTLVTLTGSYPLASRLFKTPFLSDLDRADEMPLPGISALTPSMETRILRPYFCADEDPINDFPPLTARELNTLATLESFLGTSPDQEKQHHVFWERYGFENVNMAKMQLSEQTPDITIPSARAQRFTHALAPNHIPFIYAALRDQLAEMPLERNAIRDSNLPHAHKFAHFYWLYQAKKSELTATGFIIEYTELSEWPDTQTRFDAIIALFTSGTQQITPAHIATERQAIHDAPISEDAKASRYVQLYTAVFARFSDHNTPHVYDLIRDERIAIFNTNEHESPALTALYITGFQKAPYAVITAERNILWAHPPTHSRALAALYEQDLYLVPSRVALERDCILNSDLSAPRVLLMKTVYKTAKHVTPQDIATERQEILAMTDDFLSAGMKGSILQALYAALGKHLTEASMREENQVLLDAGLNDTDTRRPLESLYKNIPHLLTFETMSSIRDAILQSPRTDALKKDLLKELYLVNTQHLNPETMVIERNTLLASTLSVIMQETLLEVLYRAASSLFTADSLALERQFIVENTAPLLITPRMEKLYRAGTHVLLPATVRAEHAAISAYNLSPRMNQELIHALYSAINEPVPIAPLSHTPVTAATAEAATTFTPTVITVASDTGCRCTIS